MELTSIYCLIPLDPWHIIDNIADGLREIIDYNDNHASQPNYINLINVCNNIIQTIYELLNLNFKVVTSKFSKRDN